MPLSVIAYDFW